MVRNHSPGSAAAQRTLADGLAAGRCAAADLPTAHAQPLQAAAGPCAGLRRATGRWAHHAVPGLLLCCSCVLASWPATGARHVEQNTDVRFPAGHGDCCCARGAMVAAPAVPWASVACCLDGSGHCSAAVCSVGCLQKLVCLCDLTPSFGPTATLLSAGSTASLLTAVGAVRRLYKLVCLCDDDFTDVIPALAVA